MGKTKTRLIKYQLNYKDKRKLSILSDQLDKSCRENPEMRRPIPNFVRELYFTISLSSRFLNSSMVSFSGSNSSFIISCPFSETFKDVLYKRIRIAPAISNNNPKLFKISDEKKIISIGHGVIVSILKGFQLPLITTMEFFLKQAFNTHQMKHGGFSRIK